MFDRVRRALEEEQDVAYAVLFGSGARGALRPASDVDIAIEFRPGAPRDHAALVRLTARLESAAEREVDLVLIDEAPAPLAYPIFRDGRTLVESDHPALVARKARVILEYLDFKPVEERCADGALRAATRGDRPLVTRRIATVRDAVARIRDVLPPSLAAFEADQTAREVVILNLFGVAHQYGAVDWARIHSAATAPDLDDLEAFCAALAAKLR